MTRQLRTLYFARISYKTYSRIVEGSFSYDLTDTVDAMMKKTLRFPKDKGYTCNFDSDKLTYTITKFGALHATITVEYPNDGIELY